MKCLLKYQWVKLLRAHMPQGKGLMGHWARLAARAAFRKGEAHYCGYSNPVSPGMWAGGIVGLKSILGAKSKTAALQILDDLKRLGYIEYTLDPSTKKLEYSIKDWVLQCSGAGAWTAPYIPQKATVFSAFPAILPSGWQNSNIGLKKQTHGWISGATQFGRIRTMRFLLWRRPSSMVPMAPH